MYIYIYRYILLVIISDNLVLNLQALVEKVMVLQKAVESSLGQQEVTSTDFARALNEYAHMLAAQGCSLTALQYLGKSNEVSTNISLY